ncbi:MAG TPA: transcription antitermination factor NusB [Candidatus Nanopelagicales bacterium]
MSARGKARKRALDVLYAAELRGVSPLGVLTEQPMAQGAANTPPQQNPYVATLVTGVVEHSVRIDELIGTYSSGWALDRMPALDRNILRLAVFELLWQQDVPAPVVIDEAVQLAQQLSTDESPAFVNGLLARILELRPRLAV